MELPGRVRAEPEPDAPTVAVLIYEGLTALDAIGPMQMLATLRSVGWRVITVAPTRGTVRADNGLALGADATLGEVKRADVLVVPGGMAGTWLAARDTAITNWVRRVHATSRATVSVCTGVWILAGAGVLKRGDTVATHWLIREDVAQLGMHYTTARYWRQERVWTSAGISAGIDVGLALVDVLAGRQAAEVAQLIAQYDPAPPFNAGTPEMAPATATRLLQQHREMMQMLKRRQR